MQQKQNLYDVVERAAYRQAVPRLELWLLVANAIMQGDLSIKYPEARMGDGSVSWPAWMVGFQAAIQRGNDPNGFGAMRYLKMIMMRSAPFDRWLRRVTKAPRGPRKGVSGYERPDRRAFNKIKRLIDSGQARSAYGAALMLARDGDLAGEGSTPESKARRVAGRYRDWHR